MFSRADSMRFPCCQQYSESSNLALRVLGSVLGLRFHRVFTTLKSARSCESNAFGSSACAASSLPLSYEGRFKETVDDPPRALFLLRRNRLQFNLSRRTRKTNLQTSC